MIPFLRAFCLIAVTAVFVSCKPEAQQTLETQIGSLVQKKASKDLIIKTLGRPAYIYTQEEASTYLNKVSESDVSMHEFWFLLSKHAETFYYPGPKTYQNYILMDEAHHATSLYFTSQ